MSPRLCDGAQIVLAPVRFCLCVMNERARARLSIVGVTTVATTAEALTGPTPINCAAAWACVIA